jgi:membrane-bound lytic murein transglycosylase D
VGKRSHFIRKSGASFFLAYLILFLLPGGMGCATQQQPLENATPSPPTVPEQREEGPAQPEAVVYAPPPIYTFPKNLTLCGEKVPLHVRHVWESMDREFTIAVYNRGQVILWIKRSNRYFPFLEKKLRLWGLPDDIKYLVVAESDLLTYAYSPKEAAGPWQFIPATAGRFGLRQGGLFDDRLSFEKSTEAALTYLQNLYTRFGSWTLAMAAYNCGEERIEKEIGEQGETNYYRLNLPLETERYIFRILACKVIMSDPEKYGFYLSPEQLYPPEEVDGLEVDFPRPMHMRIVAQACGTYFKIIKELNPEIQGNSFPTGRYSIRLPRNTKELFLRSYSEWTREARRSNCQVYVVREGDTLQKIARDRGVEVSSLKKWNNLAGNLIKPGQRLIIY